MHRGVESHEQVEELASDALVERRPLFRGDQAQPRRREYGRRRDRDRMHHAEDAHEFERRVSIEKVGEARELLGDLSSL
ncbi:MAG TPA: hypothetical protein VH062_26670 [Polyangiaceae bacterium]|nr:hypothetical protein [Polyangiaceae bacterium]